MARYGFIHDKLDIKFLVLYLMARVAAPIDFATLTDLTMCDAGVDYFEFAESVSEMVETGHLALTDERYAITEKGRRDGAACESSLPYSVKHKCSRNLSRLNGVLRRSAQVRAEIIERPEGGFTVSLGLDDDSGSLLKAELFSPTREQALRLTEGFQTRPERVLNDLLESLLEEGEESPQMEEDTQ